MNSESAVSGSLRRASVIGLGKLGSPLVACLASKGYQVIGVDVNTDMIRSLNEAKSPVYEPGLQELLSSNRERLSATEDYEFAVQNSSVTFVVVPTPSDEQGGFSLKYALPACEAIGKALRRKDDFHLVVLTSTVLPGATEGEVKPVLERYSGKRCGEGFGLCYSPEFIALGSVIRDFLNPDFILIGESETRSGEILSSLYKVVCENDPPIARMNIVSAELAKISLNAFVTTKITFANMLARICERLPGADVDAITSALGLDSRIGRKYLKGAIGYGGPCFPRDNIAFAYLARKVGASAALAEATDAMNRQQALELVKVVKSSLPEQGRVGILGLSYKPDTDVVEESPGVELARLLAGDGIPVTVYDPAAMENAGKILLDSVDFASSTEACVTESDVIVLITPWEEFKSIEPEWLANKSRRPILVDCWRILEPTRYQNVADYLALGIGRQSGQ